MPHAKWIPLLLAGWLLLCLSGFWLLWVYANTPGRFAQPQITPVFQTHLKNESGNPTLVLFAHPKCPCTRATMSELERIQADFKNSFSTLIVFYEPYGAGAEWRETDLWKRARTMHQTRTLTDIDGELALASGATTSGQIALMDSDGELLFWGGITSSRGHEGLSLGGIALQTLLKGQEPIDRRTNVFGCPLLAEAEDMECQSEEACCELADY